MGVLLVLNNTPCHCLILLYISIKKAMAISTPNQVLLCVVITKLVTAHVSFILYKTRLHKWIIVTVETFLKYVK